jgi:hypothetical protein
MSSRVRHRHVTGSLQLSTPPCHLHSELPHTRRQETSVALPDCIPFHDEPNVKEIFGLFQPISSSKEGTGRRTYNGQAYLLFSEREFFQTPENKHVNQTIRGPA